MGGYGDKFIRPDYYEMLSNLHAGAGARMSGERVAFHFSAQNVGYALLRMNTFQCARARF